MSAFVSGKPDGPGVCILLPVLNERGNIEPLLEGIAEAMALRRYFVCIVDDGSTDGTREFLESLSARQPDTYHVILRTKTGRGSQRGSALYVSLLWGLENPNTEVFVEMDGDLSHRPEELAAGLERIGSGNADVVIASKYATGSRVTNRPLSRRAVTWICNRMVRLLLSHQVQDYSNGYRFYKRRAAELIAATQIRYGSPIYLSEVMAIWLHGGMAIAEIPTTYIGRNEGISKLRYIDILKAALAVFEIAIRMRVSGFTPASAASPVRRAPHPTRTGSD